MARRKKRGPAGKRAMPTWPAEDAPGAPGEPGEMKRLGESISGTQPEIGQKETGVGRRVPPPVPPVRRGRGN
jgi:hypothetical protein